MHTHRGAVENYVKKRKKREARVLIYFEPRLSAFELPIVAKCVGLFIYFFFVLFVRARACVQREF
jgi:hypothetical protein